MTMSVEVQGSVTQSEDKPRSEDTVPARVWVTSTYFAEGFPYTVVNNLCEVLFKHLGASYAAIGYTALLHLPWNLKFLWGPLLDRYGTKRGWLVGLEGFIAAGLVLAALFADGAMGLAPLWIVFGGLALLSTTHDIAVDGYYLEALDDEGQSRFVGWRAMAYRLAIIAVGGLGLVLVDKVGWRLGLLGMAVVMVGLWGLHRRGLPHVETPERSMVDLLRVAIRPRILTLGFIVAATIAAARALDLSTKVRVAVAAIPVLGQLSFGAWISLIFLVLVLGLLAGLQPLKCWLRDREAPFAQAYISFLEQPRVGALLLLVLSFRTGESFLMKMKWPFFHDQMGVGLDVYGAANGTFGLAASVGATMLGGALIARHGLRRWLWPFILGQNLLNLLYVGLAAGVLGTSTAAVVSVITFERIGEGLGTAVFMVYLMRCCRPEHKAAHMAIVTALMSVGFTVAGVVSGELAEAVGFSAYFALSFAATLPMMLLLLVAPHLER